MILIYIFFFISTKRKNLSRTQNPKIFVEKTNFHTDKTEIFRNTFILDYDFMFKYDLWCELKINQYFI